MLGKLTVDERAKLNGGYIGGPRNPVNRDLAMPRQMKQEDPEAGPPNLREAEDPRMSCGSCAFYSDGEKMCGPHGVSCEPTQVCDDFTAMDGEDSSESEDSEDD